MTPCPPSPAVTFPEDLRCAKVTIVPEERCRRIYPGSVTANMVCAGEHRNRADSCQVGEENHLWGGMGGGGVPICGAVRWGCEIWTSFSMGRPKFGAFPSPE